MQSDLTLTMKKYFLCFSVSMHLKVKDRLTILQKDRKTERQKQKDKNRKTKTEKQKQKDKNRKTKTERQKDKKRQKDN
jgi:hypothetical protein